MAPSFRRLAWLAMSAFVLASGCSRTESPAHEPPDPRIALSRTASIIRAATSENPQTLRILFYGQSISTPAWTDRAVELLQNKYPHVKFEAHNLALGGFDSTRLARTASRDVREVYPDLIVFHVYGDHRAYEQIIRTFRSETAAEIIVSTDHVTVPVEPICDEGFSLRYSPPPGCRGHFRFRQNSWEEFMSGTWVPLLARKYQLAVEPRRQRWNAYLAEHSLPPGALLADAVHPNEAGWRLMSDLFASWFAEMMSTPPRDDRLQANALVYALQPPAAGVKTSVEFTGNRVELISPRPIEGKISARVDGLLPEEIDGCWQTTRATRLPTVHDWPAVSLVNVRNDVHRSETWTLTLRNGDPEQRRFSFEIVSSSHGADGAGSTVEQFKSSSGDVSIAPQDWVLKYGFDVSGMRLPDPFEVRWQRQFVCLYKNATSSDADGEHRYILATGLENRRHTLELLVDSSASAAYQIRVYKPFL